MVESGSPVTIMRLILIALMVLVLSSCASAGSSAIDKLDPVTAVTITFSEVPFVFYRENPGRGAFARNYVNLGPLEVNRGGTFRYYLWLGIWSTMQYVDDTEPRDGFDSVVLFADGEPLSLDIVGWTAAAIGASEPVYVKPADSAADAYYAVTVDQIRLIAEAKDLRLMSTGAPSRTFELWDEQQSARKSLAEFLQNSVYE